MTVADPSNSNGRRPSSSSKSSPLGVILAAILEIAVVLGIFVLLTSE